MLIKIIESWCKDTSNITSRKLFEDRRILMRSLGGAGIASILGNSSFSEANSQIAFDVNNNYSLDSLGENNLTDKAAVTSYNNFYEFGAGKEDPKKNSKEFVTKPWTISIQGEVKRPGIYDFEEIIDMRMLEERIYRFRCVETWSMVVPWIGIPLNKVIKKLEPTANAKFVAFQTLYDPAQMIGQNQNIISWPYVEGLRIDEAMHDLTLLVVGVYGDVLPNQNGAPIRLIVPWKYGFKSIKSIVQISFVEKQPPCTWNMTNPREYGFYSNVNPHVNHPRWGQAWERKIGEGLWNPKKPTLLFNGYADQVAHLYDGMDLKKFY